MELSRREFLKLLAAVPFVYDVFRGGEWQDCVLRISTLAWLSIQFRGLCSEIVVWDGDRLSISFDLHCNQVMKVVA
jgi:hypothetical protein